MFALAGCPDPTNEPKDLSGNITISPESAATGTELTANYSGSEAVTYQWNKDGTAINGATAQKYTPTEAGSYTVTISADGYKSKTSETVEVTPEPVEQTKTLSEVKTALGSVNVIINYMAVPGKEPSYMDDLVTVIHFLLRGAMEDSDIPLIINVIATGPDGFEKTASRTLSVRESWISNATDIEIAKSLTDNRPSWIAYP
jgi:hypothetical protein